MMTSGLLSQKGQRDVKDLHGTKSSEMSSTPIIHHCDPAGTCTLWISTCALWIATCALWIATCALGISTCAKLITTCAKWILHANSHLIFNNSPLIDGHQWASLCYNQIFQTGTVLLLSTPQYTATVQHLCKSCYHIYGLCRQKQVSQTGLSNCIPQYSVGCNYLSLPEIPAFVIKVLIYATGIKVLTYATLQLLVPCIYSLQAWSSLWCWAICTHSSGPVLCLLLGVSSGCARPITGQVTSVTWPVIGWA